MIDDFLGIIGGPELGTETPGIFAFHTGVETRRTGVFAVEEDDVHRGGQLMIVDC